MGLRHSFTSITRMEWETCLRLPFEPDDDNARQDDDGNSAYDADVVDVIVNDLVAVSFQQIIERFTESDRVHGDGDGIGNGKDDADRGPEMRTQRA